jgi:hypothetical protein
MGSWRLLSLQDQINTVHFFGARGAVEAGVGEADTGADVGIGAGADPTETVSVELAGGGAGAEATGLSPAGVVDTEGEGSV